MICGSWLGKPEVVRLGESIVVTSTQKLERATYALITYYNYIRAYVICINRLYGSCDDGINAFITKIKCSTAFKRVQGGALTSSELINAYSRGRLTLRWGAPIISTTYNERLPAFSTGCLTSVIWFFS